MKFLLDMNLAPRWVAYLSQLGIDAQHWSQTGRPNAPDNEIMEYAATHGFVVITQDLDFSAILAASSENKQSVVQLRAGDTTPEVAGPQLVAALKQNEAELAKGALLTIDVRRTRVRLLPFG